MKCHGDTREAGDAWKPVPLPGAAPFYLRLADAIARDIESGRLADGARLTSQRDLAKTLRVTLGTVTRAFAEAKRRGLIACETGRGSYARKPAPRPMEFDVERATDPSLFDFGPSNSLRIDALERTALRDVFAAMARRIDAIAKIRAPDFVADDRVRGLVAPHLARIGLPFAPPDDVMLVCQGAQQGIAAVFGALARPGDIVLTESLTYPGIRRLAEAMRIRLHPVRVDKHGLDPEALDAACRKAAPKLLYCVPTLNPATATLTPDARRREIAQVLLRHGTWLLEDDDDSCMATVVPPLAARVKSRACFLLDSTKLMTPGLRLAYLVVPAALARHIRGAVQTLSWAPAPLQNEIGALLLELGHSAKLVAARRAEIANRHAIVRSTLPRSSGFRYDLPRGAHHLWLELDPLGPRLRAETAVASAMRAGVRIVGPDAFVVPPATQPRAVRVSLSAEADRTRFVEGLARLKAALAPH